VHGTALTNDIAILIIMNILVSLLLHKPSYSNQILTINCPNHLVDASYSYPPSWVLLHPDGLLVLLPTEVWKDGIVWMEKKDS
jgi:hypothetical protein